MVRRHRRVQVAAAVAVQTCFRRYVNRRKEHRAATALQKLVRCFLCRQRFLKERSAAVHIQRQWRAVQKIRRLYREYLIMNGAAMTIQASFRSWVQRKKYCMLIGGIISLQAVVRMVQQRRQYQRLRTAATCLQTRYRRIKLARRMRTEFMRMRSSALLIQHQFRQWKTQQEMKRRTATVLIQAAYRGFVQRCNFTKMRSAAILIQYVYRRWRHAKTERIRNTAASVIQKYARAYLIGRRQRAWFLHTLSKVTLVQSTWRTYIARKIYMNASAAKIQAAFRAYTCRKAYQKLLGGIVKLQACTRRWLVVQRYRALLTQHRAARVIQRAYFQHWQCKLTQVSIATFVYPTTWKSNFSW